MAYTTKTHDICQYAFNGIYAIINSMQTPVTSSQPQARMCFIAFDGTFYPLAFRTHESVAQELTNTYHNNLLRQGYVALTAEGWMCDLNTKPTLDQKYVAREVTDLFLSASSDTDWDVILNENPEDYEVDFTDGRKPTHNAKKEKKSWPEYVQEAYELWFGEDKPALVLDPNMPPADILSTRVDEMRSGD